MIEVNKFDEKIRTLFDEWVHFLKTDEVKPEFTAKSLSKNKLSKKWGVNPLIK